jgi:type VI secretion system Hcp family effector
MDLISFGHGVDRPYATGGGWDPAHIQDFIFTKKSDKSSPKFNEAILAGKCFDEVEIHFCTTVGAEEEVPVYKLKLQKVRITSYNLNGLAEGVSMETVSMYADKIEWTYSVQDDESAEGEVMYAYDVKARKAG